MRMSEFGNGFSKILKASKNQDGSSDKVHKLPAISIEKEENINLNVDKQSITPRNDNLKLSKNMHSNNTAQQDSTNDES